MSYPEHLQAIPVYLLILNRVTLWEGMWEVYLVFPGLMFTRGGRC